MRAIAAVSTALLIAMIVASGAASALTGQLQLVYQYHPTPNQGQPYWFGVAMKLEDVTLDGHADTIVYNTSAIAIYSGANGGLIEEILPTPGTIAFGSHISVGNALGDARPEILVSSATPDQLGRVDLFSSSGALILTVTHPTPSENLQGEVLLADVIGDSYDEMIVSGSAGVRIFSGDGVHLGDLPVPSGYVVRLAAGDFDGDGREDIAAGRPDPGNPANARIYLYNDVWSAPAVEIPQPPPVPNYGFFPVSMAAGDADGDGQDELWVSANGIPGVGGAVFRFGGDGVLQQTHSPPVPNGTFGDEIGVGDLDGDGRDDVAVPESDQSNDDGHVFVFNWEGDLIASVDESDVLSNFPSSTLFSESVAMGDATGDGKDDLVASASRASRVYLFSNDASFVPAPVGGLVEIIQGQAGKGHFGFEFLLGLAVTIVGCFVYYRRRRATKV